MLSMQENKQEKSPIKARILYYLDYMAISRYSFYKETGITRGVLDQNNGISEENLMKFLDYAQDISPIWLLTGEGDMFKEEVKSVDKLSPLPPPRNKKNGNLNGNLIAKKGEHPEEKLLSDENNNSSTATTPNRVTAIHPDPGKVYDSLPQEASQFNEPDVEYDPSLAHIQMPVVEPENVFSGLTQEEVDKELKDALRDALMAMFQSGEIYSATVVREYQDQIKELAGQVARLEYQMRELGLTQIDGIWRHLRKTKENKGERGK